MDREPVPQPAAPSASRQSLARIVLITALAPFGQTELAISMHTAYDDSYGGPATDPAEGERLAGLIGDKKVLMMANHGVATVAPTVSEAMPRAAACRRTGTRRGPASRNTRRYPSVAASVRAGSRRATARSVLPASW